MKHDQLQAQCFQWAHNTFPAVRGYMFAVMNEVHPKPNETPLQFKIRVTQLKAIGLRKGVLDWLCVLPPRNEMYQTLRQNWDGEPYTITVGDIVPAATYGFDIKIGPDKFSKEQSEFVEKLRKCGGDGWEIRSLDQFKGIFTALVTRHFGQEEAQRAVE